MVNSKIVAEIEKCYNECLKRAKFIDSDYWNAKAEAYRNVLAILDDTIEVKEVDLKKLLSDLDRHIKEFVATEEFERESTIAGHYWVIAKYAFLLGLKAQQGKH